MVSLHVIPDTNFLWQREPMLLSASFLSAVKDTADVVFRVSIPRVVVAERKYQISQVLEGEKSKILNGLSSMEIVPTAFRPPNEDVRSILAKLKLWDVRKTIEDHANEELLANSVSILELSWDDVNWKTLIEDAAWRRPPFEGTESVGEQGADEKTRRGRKEKGFRDRIFCETVIQAIAKSPEENWCILSGDGKVREFLRARLAENVRIFADPEKIGQQLRAHGNYLYLFSGDAPAVLHQASDLFFDAKSGTGLWTTENLADKILTGTTGELVNALPRWPLTSSELERLTTRAASDESANFDLKWGLLQRRFFPISLMSIKGTKLLPSAPIPRSTQEGWNLDELVFRQGETTFRSKPDSLVKWRTEIYFYVSYVLLPPTFFDANDPLRVDRVVNDGTVYVEWTSTLDGRTLSNPAFERVADLVGLGTPGTVGENEAKEIGFRNI